MPKKKNKKQIRHTISIVIPAKDEEENINILLNRIKKIIQKLKTKHNYSFEIIVVCDNCTDKTEKIAKSHKVIVVKRTGNPGKSKALIEGFKKSKGNIIVMMDADLSHLPEELPKMIKALISKEENGLVVASRFAGKSDDVTIIREFGGRMFNVFTNLFFRTNLTDAINGFKIFERHVFDNHIYTADGYAIEIELVANTLRAGKKVAEIPSYEAKRAGGEVKSKVIKDGWLFLREIITEGVSYNKDVFKRKLTRKSLAKN
jgi:dolichol-phosphate mannosyltransferase